MNCQEALQLLPRRVDDRLAGDEQALLERHLGACAACRSEEAGQAHTDALLAAAFSDHPFGDAAVERVLSGLPGQRPAASAPKLRFVPLGAGFAAAAAVLLAVLLAFDRPPATQPGPGGSQPTPVLASAGPGLLLLDAGGATDELERGAELHAGQHLVALSTGVVRLPDGTRVDVQADTEFSLRQEQDGGTAVVLESEGRVYCEVAKRRQPFRVVSRDLTVEVLGTRFGVTQEVRLSRVVVLQGRVEAYTRGDRRVLTADMAAEARPDHTRLETLKITALDHLRWVPRLATQPSPAPARPSPPPVVELPQQAPAPGTQQPGDPSLDTPVLPPGRDELPGEH